MKKKGPPPPPLGNQRAKGCTTGGRPRTVSYSKEDMIALGEEMIEWVKENDPIHLSKWYSIEKDFTDKQWETMSVAPEFFPYYRKALKMVGYKYLTKDSPVDSSLKQRWQRVYFKDLRDQEDADIERKLSLEAKYAAEKPQVDPEAVSATLAVLEQIKEAQEARKEADKSKRTA